MVSDASQIVPPAAAKARISAGARQKSTGILNLGTFKVFPCRRLRTAPHDRKTCPFYHNMRDRRRPPGTYDATLCPQGFDGENTGKSQGHCAKGDQCTQSHNRLEVLYHEAVFKRRFCASFTEARECNRDSFCAFAHSQGELRAVLLRPEEEAVSSGALVPESFFIEKFKTLWCPFGVQHDWHKCAYAHTYQDWRRHPGLGYSSEPCRHWNRNENINEYEKRCPNGYLCSMAHGSKEQLYHNLCYKTIPCNDWTATGVCPRDNLCAFYHSNQENRASVIQKSPETGRWAPGQQGEDSSAGTLPNAEHLWQLLEELQPAYRSPPLFSVEQVDRTEGESLATASKGRRSEQALDSKGKGQEKGYLQNWKGRSWAGEGSTPSTAPTPEPSSVPPTMLIQAELRQQQQGMYTDNQAALHSSAGIADLREALLAALISRAAGAPEHSLRCFAGGLETPQLSEVPHPCPLSMLLAGGAAAPQMVPLQHQFTQPVPRTSLPTMTAGFPQPLYPVLASAADRGHTWSEPHANQPFFRSRLPLAGDAPPAVLGIFPAGTSTAAQPQWSQSAEGPQTSGGVERWSV